MQQRHCFSSETNVWVTYYIHQEIITKNNMIILLFFSLLLQNQVYETGHVIGLFIGKFWIFLGLLVLWQKRVRKN